MHKMREYANRVWAKNKFKSFVCNDTAHGKKEEKNYKNEEEKVYHWHVKSLEIIRVRHTFIRTV